MLLLWITLRDTLQYFDANKKELVDIQYKLESINFEQVLMPKLDNDDVRKIPYQRVNIYTKTSEDRHFKCYVYIRRLYAALVYTSSKSIAFRSKDACLDQIAEDLYAVNPYDHDSNVKFEAITDTDTLSVVTVKVKNLVLNP